MELQLSWPTPLPKIKFMVSTIQPTAKERQQNIVVVRCKSSGFLDRPV